MDSHLDRSHNHTGWANNSFWRSGALLVSLLIAGCASSDARTNRAPLAAELQQRTWHDIPAETCPGEMTLPPAVLLEDGLSEEEALAIALWNNAQFHATLSQLGMARGDFVQAGLLTNPQFQCMFPGGDKQLEYMLFLPVEAMFFRKHRITIAEREYCRIAQELVQNGLNLIRDVRVAYADLVFAVERAALAEEATHVRSRIASLSEKRLEAGDISQLEATTADIDARTARAEAAGLHEQVAVARERLANLLGIGLLDIELIPTDRRPSPPADLDVDVLMADALVSRPDLRAAQYAIAATDQQAGLARWTWLRFDAALDRNLGGNGPTNIGPALRMDIPIFNRNQGGIIRSDWTVDQALHNFDAVRDRVVMEVRTAAAQLRQAEVSLAILQDEVLPLLSGAVETAENAYLNGGTTYFLALQTTTQFLDARARELELLAAEHRALAELERSIGRRVSVPASSEPEEQPDLHLSSRSEHSEPQQLTSRVAFCQSSADNATSLGQSRSAGDSDNVDAAEPESIACVRQITNPRDGLSDGFPSLEFEWPQDDHWIAIDWPVAVDGRPSHEPGWVPAEH